jgi:uncharacterized protein with HEPN domain
MTEPRDVLVVIGDMLDHIEYVRTRVESLGPAQFVADRDIRQSVERSLEIISEASRNLPGKLKDTRPDIPWRQVADFGNILRHIYYAVDAAVVWDIITIDLPALEVALLDMRAKVTG